MDTNSSNSSTEGGNTNPPPKKQISPAIRWCFTLNNWTSEEFEEICSIVPEICRYCIIGSEVGEECETPHLQGYIEFKTKKRPMSVFNNKKIHWEKAKGNKEQNRDYCSKETVIFEYPKRKVIKTIKEEQFYEWQKQIIEEIKEEPDDRTIHWLYGEGNIGKTSFCKYLIIHENFTILGGKASDCRNGVVEYMKDHDGECPERIVINIPRSYAKDYVSYEAYENLKDMLFYSGKYEGKPIVGNCPHLYIFANFHPDIDKMSEDRWNIKQIAAI